MECYIKLEKHTLFDAESIMKKKKRQNNGSSRRELEEREHVGEKEGRQWRESGQQVNVNNFIHQLT